MPNWRMKAVLLASSVLAVGATIGAPSAAQAAENQCTNESGNFCFWAAADFGLAFKQVSGSNENWSNLSVSGSGCTHTGWNDCASSARNEGKECEAVVHSDIKYGGDDFVINREDHVTNFVNWGMPTLGGNWNDKISSNDWFC